MKISSLGWAKVCCMYVSNTRFLFNGNARPSAMLCTLKCLVGIIWNADCTKLLPLCDLGKKIDSVDLLTWIRNRISRAATIYTGVALPHSCLNTVRYDASTAATGINADNVHVTRQEIGISTDGCWLIGIGTLWHWLLIASEVDWFWLISAGIWWSTMCPYTDDCACRLCIHYDQKQRKSQKLW